MMPMGALDAIMHDMIPFSRLSTEQPRITQDDTRYTIVITAPGVSAADVKVTALESRIHVKGATADGTNTHVVYYTLTLGEDADTENASASCADGLVTVTVPKKEREVATVVAIGVSTDAAMETTDCECGDECPCDDEKRCEGMNEEKKPYTLTVVAAGLAAADLQLSAEGRVLSIKGETARTGAKLRRVFHLPRDATLERATATHVDGILTVSVPRKATAQPKAIAVEAGADREPTREEEKELDGAVMV